MARKTYRIKDALNSLVEDEWRKSNKFSDDLRLVNDIFLAPFVTEHARAEALGNWLQKADAPPGQPCMFGRIAAAQKTMHYCFLDDADLREDDQEIRRRIKSALVDWKRRAVDPARSHPAHGFMLCLISPELAHAAPDSNLLAFARAVHDLAGWPVENGFTKETLYLRNPDDGSYVRFTFTVDFFGAQGDRRWWHDHRVPGGIAFTANSAGHMVRHREWYTRLKKRQIEWLVQTAMLTINAAVDVGFGAASKLIDLSAQGPVVAAAGCPFKDVTALKPALQGKDWSRYSGWHHSDQCVRSEFFTPGSDVPGDLKAKGTWYQDFGYLYDPRNPEHVRFILGEPCAEKEIDDELGVREEWTTNVEPISKRSVRMDSYDPSEEAAIAAQREIERLLEETRKWVRMSDDLVEDAEI